MPTKKPAPAKKTMPRRGLANTKGILNANLRRQLYLQIDSQSETGVKPKGKK